MATDLENIQIPIAAELEEFEQKFKRSMKSHVLLLDKITTYIVRRKGKQMRPMFVFLAAGACGAITERTYRGAALIELLHTATLVHDDVVDDSNYRRGFFSVNALWKNKIAVLVGDYLLSKGLLLSVQNKDFDLLELVSDAVRQMSEGELLQMEKARRLDIDESVYFEIIKQKTASLITSCCSVGAASAMGGPKQIEILKQFGYHTGMAFQIKDDLFDYGQTSIGKPVGIDIKEKKMTLPLIHALGQATSGQKRHIINLIKNQSHKPDKVQEIILFVKQTGGLQYATQAMQNHYQQALQALAPLPDSTYLQSLKDLLSFTIDRKK